MMKNSVKIAVTFILTAKFNFSAILQKSVLISWSVKYGVMK